MSPSQSGLVTLRVLGTPELRGLDGQRSASVLAQPKRLCLLTYLALAPSPVSRAAIVAVFWPDKDEARARNSLSQAIFHLRRALGESVVASSEGDRLWAPPDRIWCDARELLSSESPEPSVMAACDRELLEGWNADDSQPLQEWLELQRARLRERAASLARAATPPPPPPTISPAPLSSPTGLRKAPRGAAVVLAAIGLLAALGAAVVGGAFAASRFSEPSLEDLVVLLPRVVTSPEAHPLSAESVLEEILAHLPGDLSLRIIPTPSASSVADLRRQLALLGVAVEDGPDWILEVSLRVTGDEVRAVALLHRSPTMDVTGREGFGLAHGGAERALVELPRDIANRVATMVAEAVGESAGGR